MQRNSNIQFLLLRQLRDHVNSEELTHFPKELVVYNSALLVEGGYVDGNAHRGHTGQFETVVSRGLTNAGHDLLEQLEAALPATSPGTTAPTRRHPRRLLVFLCHASQDKLQVRKLHAWLQNKGFQPWLDEVDLLPGQDWELEIASAVRKSDVVLVCLSPAAVSKTGFFQKEIKWALDAADHQPEGKIFIIPVLFAPCEVPNRFRGLQHVDFTQQDAFAKLKAALQKRLSEITLRDGEGL